MTVISNNGIDYDVEIMGGVLQTRIVGAATWDAHPQMVGIVAANAVGPWIIAIYLDGTYHSTRIESLTLYNTAYSWDYDGTAARLTPIPIQQIVPRTPTPGVLTVIETNIPYDLKLVAGVLEIKKGVENFVTTGLTNVVAARYVEPNVLAVLADGTHRKLDVKTPATIDSSATNPAISTEYTSAVTANAPAVQGTGVASNVTPPTPAPTTGLSVTSNGITYRLNVISGRVQIAISTGDFVETVMGNVLSARFDDPWIIALLTNGTYQKMRITDRLFAVTDLYEPNLKAQYDAAVTANDPLLPGTAAVGAPPAPVNAILPSTAAELEQQRRQNHVNGGRSFAVVATSGTSRAILIGLNAGITVAAISGTARVYQTSSCISHVQTSRAVWEVWSLGTTTTAGQLSGNIQNATAVYLESIGGIATMSIRD
jgi:hypothetical protein